MSRTPIPIDSIGCKRVRSQRDGEFRDFDPPLIAVTVSQAVIGVLGSWMADSTIDLTAYAAELVTLFDRATRR